MVPYETLRKQSFDVNCGHKTLVAYSILITNKNLPLKYLNVIPKPLSSSQRFHADEML